MGYVYLLHFDKPYKHAAHYCGYTKDLETRLDEHASGTGARLMQVIREAGIGFKLARVWRGQGRKFERRLKRTKSVRDYCPECMGEKARKYKPKNKATNATRVADTLPPF